MDINKIFETECEKPLDNLNPAVNFTSIFRKIACIGDSLSSGEFEIIDHTVENPPTEYFDCYEQSWGQYIARHTGSTVYNFSRGGMSVKEYVNSFADSKGFWNEDLKSQAYIIALGVNDITQMLNGEIDFGSADDISKDDFTKNAHTFAGYYAYIMSRYKQIAPNAKFFLMTAPHTSGTDEKRAELEDKHAELMYEFAKIFTNTYVLDFRRYAPEYDDEFKKKFYLENHLNPLGYLLTARMVESYIDYIIRKNPEDFAKVGLIGTKI